MSEFQFHLGDCLEKMERLESHSVDMILCDLPYGTTACAWDSVIDFQKLWSSYRRITKRDSAIVLTSSQPFTSALVMSNPNAFKYSWVWEKNKGSGHLNAARMPMKYHEDVLVFSFGTPPYFAQETTGHKPMSFAKNKQNNINGRHGSVESGGATTRKPRSVLFFPVVNNDGTSDGGRFHPSQKPLSLLEYMISTYSREGDVVLDNAMGSGSTGVACLSTRRKFIGIENDESYFNVAVQRIKSAIASSLAPKQQEMNYE